MTTAERTVTPRSLKAAGTALALGCVGWALALLGLDPGNAVVGAAAVVVAFRQGGG